MYRSSDLLQEPIDGLEPPTYRLQGDCTAFVLYRLVNMAQNRSLRHTRFIRPPLFWLHKKAVHIGNHKRYDFQTPTVGFEPTDLSAPLFSKQFAYNHLHTLAYPLIKPPVLLKALYTSGDFPELPTTTPHGQWSYLSGKVFLQDFASRLRILLGGKQPIIWIEQMTHGLQIRYSTTELYRLSRAVPLSTDCPLLRFFLWQFFWDSHQKTLLQRLRN